MLSDNRRHRNAILAMVAIGLALPLSAGAQTLDDLRQRNRIPVPSGETVRPVPGVLPGISVSTPTAYGANFGDVFIGAGFQARTRYAPSGRDGIDGSAVAGIGLGNSARAVGVEVAMTFLSTIDSRLFDRTSFSFKVHRLLPANVGIAVGWENAVVIGDDADGGDSLYGVVSKVFQFPDPDFARRVSLSLGVGNGRFRFEDDVLSDRDRVNVFGSVGVDLIPSVSLLADWTGQDLAMGASWVPFTRFPLVITPGFADITGHAGDGARFILGVGYGTHIPSIARAFD